MTLRKSHLKRLCGEPQSHNRQGEAVLLPKGDAHSVNIAATKPDIAAADQ